MQTTQTACRIDHLLETLLVLKGSDLHLSSGGPPMARVHGHIRTLSGKDSTPEETAALLMEIMTHEAIAAFEQTCDVDFAYALGEHARFRVNVFRDRSGMGAVLRHVPGRVPTFDELNLPPVIRTFAELPKGIVLVTGPTGSGKSTTLAAIIDEVNTARADHIITIEDPIEFVHSNKNCLVNQREVGPHTKSFAAALRATLREDPDVILVGEMRDLETTMMALEAAETGHLVFSTLHTSSAAGTVDRIIDQFPAESQAQVRTMLASNLQGVVAQCLFKRLDGKGRVAALEILASTPAVASMIREGKTHQLVSTIQTGGRLGMCLLNDSIVKLVSRGIVDPLEGYTKSMDKEGLVRSYQVAGVKFEGPRAAVPPRAVERK